MPLLFLTTQRVTLISSGRCGSHFRQRHLPCLRHTEDGKETTERANGGVDKEGAAEAEGRLQVHERFDAGKGESVADGGGECAAGRPIVQREQLAHQQPRQRLDADAGRCFKNKNKQQRQPVVVFLVKAAAAGQQLDVATVVAGDARCLTEESVDAEAGEGEAHDEAGTDEQRPSAHLVRQQTRHRGGRQLDGRRHDGHQVRVDLPEHHAVDVDGVEVEGEAAGEPVEEHEAGGERDRPHQLRHQHTAAVVAALAQPADIVLEEPEVGRHVHVLALQPLKGPKEIYI